MIVILDIDINFSSVTEIFLCTLIVLIYNIITIILVTN